MTALNIIGVVMLIGGVLGYGALFLWVITADKRKARKEGDILEVPGKMPIRHRSRGGVGVWAVVCHGRGSPA